MLQQGRKRITPTVGVKPQRSFTRRDLLHVTNSAPSTTEPPPPALKVEGLSVDFRRRRGWFSSETVRPVQDVSFSIAPGRTLAIVGESGSGKTSVARAVVGLVVAHQGLVTIAGTRVPLDGSVRPAATRRLVQMVFQDPGGSMNPMHRIEEVVSEPLAVHRPGLRRDERRAMALSVLERCGMPADALDRYPHQFSGGQKQRIAVARAIILRPPLVICDEPTSALDVSIQAQVINLLRELQRELGLSYLFISHDLAVVRQMADDTVVMTGGRIVEAGPTERIIDAPEADYTRKLVAAVVE